jgi:hypothetical protein
MSYRAFGVQHQSGPRVAGEGIIGTIFNAAIGAVLLPVALSAIRRMTRCARLSACSRLFTLSALVSR